ncbi:SpoIIE family protein phosphatase [Ruminococcus sp.]|uniref:SpoIIE family protein phosphatase n=1 Tax=Ruminococcus sp. TaxID=41978 RepID=UPI00388FDC39
MSVVQAVRRGRAKRKTRLGANGIAREVALHISCFIAGGIVSRGATLGELSPFGASLVAAVPFAYMPAGMLGAALSYLFSAPSSTFRYIAVVVAIGAIRWVLGEVRKISGSRFYAPVVAFIPVFATGIALTFSAKSEMTEAVECVIEALIAAAGAYFMNRTALLFESKRALSGFTQQELSCLSMTGCILLLSMSGVMLGIVSVGRVLAVLLILLFARYGLIKGGSIAGIATGAVFALSDNKLLFLAAEYSLSGLIGGLLAPMGKAAVVFAALICGTMFAFASPDRSMVLSVAVECGVASGIFLLIPKDAGNFLSSVFSDDAARTSEEAIRRNLTTRLEHCSKALDNVSSCVNAVSDRLARLYEPNANWIYERAADFTCKGCGLRAYCWERERGMTLDDFHRLTDTLRERGFIKEGDIEDRFLKRCCKSAELAHSVNRSYREYLSMEAARRRITGVRSVVAGQFAGLSDILHDLSEEFMYIEGYDEACADRVIEALSAAGLTVADCSCRTSAVGGMTVELEIAVGKKTVLSKSELNREVCRACGRYFESPVLSFEGDRARAVLCELPLFDLEIGSAQHVCDDGELCGDCLNYFVKGTGSTVAMISDGMGSGGRAAVDANMAVSIMTKLCKAGLSYDCSLAVVNSSLMIKSEEESLATLDMLDFNCFTGQAALMKAGACTTFIKKNSRMLQKEMPSLPLGILNEARFNKEDVTLTKDDWIVMVSDGALVGSPDWIEKLIMSWREGSAEQLAAHIVDEAKKRRRDEHDDDITAIAMKVVENG